MALCAGQNDGMEVNLKEKNLSLPCVPSKKGMNFIMNYSISEDIKNVERKHAIIIIKNKDGQYLQIFQDTWNSYLFINCKVEDENDTDSVNRCIKEILGAEPTSIEYKFGKVHTKFSEKDKINKKYHHYFFVVEVELENSIGEFQINENRFKWFSYEELLKDKRIQQVNSDIVGFIKEIF